MDAGIVSIVLSAVVLLMVSTLVTFLLEKTTLPQSAVLVLIGVGLGVLIKQWDFLSFMASFRLSPEVIFYLFLPTLIFESAFKMRFEHFMNSAANISMLSTFGLIGSTFIIGYAMHWVLGLPLLFCLLFGSLISETDPVTILALFKKLGAPKKLTTIIEGESLFQDGVAVVLFSILYEQQSSLAQSVGSFFAVSFGGLILGAIFGFVFSKLLDFVDDSKEIEITITLILAHSTFIIAEYFFHVSGILATIAAGIVLGNYGAYKISPSVKEFMEHFWDYGAYLANSLLFLMVGLLGVQASDSLGSALKQLPFVIFVVYLARAVMVYLLIPITGLFVKRERIPFKWVHVVYWSGMRGALGIALALSIPMDYPFYDKLLVFTLGVVLVNIVVNGFTVLPLMNLLKLNKLNPQEDFEQEESRLLVQNAVEEKLLRMKHMGFIEEDIYKKVSAKYAKDFSEHMDEFTEHIKQAPQLEDAEMTQTLREHLLGIERSVFEELYKNGEITQNLLSYLVANLNQQLDQSHTDDVVRLTKIGWLNSESRMVALLSTFGFKGLRLKLEEQELFIRYEMYRARQISSAEVLHVVESLKQVKGLIKPSILEQFEEKYKVWREKSAQKLEAIKKDQPDKIREIQVQLGLLAALKTEEEVLHTLLERGILNENAYANLKKEWVHRRKQCVSC